MRSFSVLSFQLVILLGASLCIIEKSLADCTSPAAQAGAIEWFAADSKYRLCDGASWGLIDMDTASLGTGCTPKSRKYDTATKSLKICDTGGTYRKANCVSGSAGPNVVCKADLTNTGVSSKLTMTGGVASPMFGTSVAFAGDGSRVIIGAAMDNSNQGAAAVFVRSGSTWTQEGSKLTLTGGVGTPMFGVSVGMNADGTRVIVGANLDNSQGAAAVFTRSGSTWTQEGAKLTLTGGSGANINFGASVAINADATRVVVGAPADNSNQGAVAVFLRSGTTWTQEGSKLTLTGSVGANVSFGASVAINGDGSRLIAGAYGDNSNQGAAAVFARSGTTWSQEGSKLTLTGGVGSPFFGNTVGIDASGNRVVIGGGNDNSGQGTIAIFARSGSTWTQEGAKLTLTGGVGTVYLGESAAINADGTRVVVGARGDSTSQGAAAIFSRSGTTWTQEGPKLTLTGGVGTPQFGNAVAMTSDGTRVLIAADADNSNVGAAQIFDLTVYRQDQAKVTLTGGTGATIYFGESAAMSADGLRAVVGAEGDNSSQGAAAVFVRSGSTWTQEGSKLTLTGGSGTPWLGISVGINADGSRIVVGAGKDNTNQGAIAVFVRSGSTWTQEGSKLTLTGGSGTPNFGWSVAMSGDGLRVVAGAPLDNTNQGAAAVFVRSGSTWTQEGSKLTLTGGAGNPNFGQSVSINSDGTRIVVGAPGDNSSLGAAAVFVRSGSTWSQEGAKLTLTGGAGAVYTLGYSVAMSADGNRFVAGAYQDNSTQGAAAVFVRSGSTWTQEGAKLTMAGGVSSPRFGYSVAINSTGTRVVGGAFGDNSNQGAAAIFVRSGSTWNQEGTKLTLAGGAGTPSFGTSVGMNADGSRVIVGGSADNSNQGAAEFFIRAPVAVSRMTCSSQVAQGTAQAKPPGASPWTALSSMTLTAGQALLVCVSTGDSISSMTWNGAAMTKDVEVGSATNAHAYIYSLANASAGTGNLVITYTAAPAKGSAVTAVAVNDLATAAILDKSASAIGSSAAPSSGATAVPTQAQEFTFGCVSANGPADSTPVWTSGLTADQTISTSAGGPTSNWSVYEAYKDGNSSAAQTAAMTLATSRGWAAAVATYKRPTTGVMCNSYDTCTTPGMLEFFSTGLSVLRWCDGTVWRQIYTTP